MDSEAARLGNSIHICSEEEELPTVLFLLMLDHLFDLVGPVHMARILPTVGRDYEDNLLRPQRGVYQGRVF